MADEKKKVTSKEVGSKIKSYFEKGVAVSKKGLKSAGSAISDFGDKSVTKIELAQLKSKLSKEYAVFGEVAYTQLVTKKADSIDLKAEDVKKTVDSITKLIKDIKKHEKNIKESGEKLDNKGAGKVSKKK